MKRQHGFVYLQLIGAVLALAAVSGGLWYGIAKPRLDLAAAEVTAAQKEASAANARLLQAESDIERLETDATARDSILVAVGEVKTQLGRGLSNVQSNLRDISEFASPEVLACLRLPAGDLDRRLRGERGAGVPAAEDDSRPPK